jgi:hypothetical protein
MSNYKTIIVYAACAVWLYSCKPTSKSFSYKDNIDKDFFAQTMSLAGLEDMGTDSIKVFRAELVERLVERDAVPEYRLINKKSDQKYVSLADSKNQHFLYLFQLFPAGGTDTVFLYMATSFSASGICTALGPVYLGMQRRDRIQFKSILKIEKLKPKDQPQSIKDMAKAGEIIRRYHINEKKDTTQLIFLNDQRFPRAADRITPIRIRQIIRNEPNKIGGDKAVIFTTDKVFEDTEALVFTYYSTIKTQ